MIYIYIALHIYIYYIVYAENATDSSVYKSDMRKCVCVSCFLSESEHSSSLLSPSRAVTFACTLDRFKMSQG